MARGRHGGSRTGARTGARAGARTGTRTGARAGARTGTRHGGHRRRGRHRRRGVVNYYPSYPYYPYGYDQWRNYREPPYIMMPNSQPQKTTQLSIHLPTIAVSLGLSYLLWGRGR